VNRGYKVSGRRTVGFNAVNDKSFFCDFFHGFRLILVSQKGRTFNSQNHVSLTLKLGFSHGETTGLELEEWVDRSGWKGDNKKGTSQ
jgi:hypothetical protein